MASEEFRHKKPAPKKVSLANAQALAKTLFNTPYPSDGEKHMKNEAYLGIATEDYGATPIPDVLKTDYHAHKDDPATLGDFLTLYLPLKHYNEMSHYPAESLKTNNLADYWLIVREAMLKLRDEKELNMQDLFALKFAPKLLQRIEQEEDIENQRLINSTFNPPIHPLPEEVQKHCDDMVAKVLGKSRSELPPISPPVPPTEDELAKKRKDYVDDAFKEQGLHRITLETVQKVRSIAEQISESLGQGNQLGPARGNSE